MESVEDKGDSTTGIVPGKPDDVNRKRKRVELGDEFDESVHRTPRDARLADSVVDPGVSTGKVLSPNSNATKKQEVEVKKYYDTRIGTGGDDIVEEGNNLEDDGRMENYISMYDPVCFFSSPTFPQEHLEEARRRISHAFEDPFRRLGEDGVQKYLQHIRQRDSLKSKKEIGETERFRKIMKDATITGDPRVYQRMLFEIAKSTNTIIHLGTGFGKTLIALMCIRHFSPSFEEGKQTLFLVPSVALAIQQSITLRANLPKYDVRTACYTSTNSDSARESLAKCNVIVATHGAILDLMMHYADMFQMNHFNLLVVDECHYATGNHAYSVIMNKFYHVLPKEERPRVIGLTASPLCNVRETHSDEQLEAMLANLEDTLDSRLVSATALVSEFSTSLMKSAEERVVDFHGSCLIGRAIPSADNLELHQGRYREFKQLDFLYKDLGPLVVGIYCSALVRELSRNEFENETSQQFKTALKLLMNIQAFCAQECLSNPNLSRTDKLLALEELLEAEVEDQAGAETVGLVFVERRITAIALHNYFIHRSQEIERGKWVKANVLRKQASRRIPGVAVCTNAESQFDDSCDDPFVAFQDEQQHSLSQSPPSPQAQTTAASTPEIDGEDQFMDADDDSYTLAQDCINGAFSLPDVCTPLRLDLNHRAKLHVVETKSRIRTSAIVRNATQIFKSLCSSRKSYAEQENGNLTQGWLHQETNVREMLTKLRRGEVNLLFATSVVEEGVDVQACSFVAVFDALKNTKGYIQMKGRARQRNAKFFVFRDTDDTGGSNLPLKVAQDMERRIQQFIESKSRSRLPAQLLPSKPNLDSSGSEVVQNEYVALEAGCYTVTHGRVDVHSAKSLLNRYALSVPLDPFCRNSKESLFAHLPYFGSDNLVLPSHLPSEVRVVTLPEKYQHLPKKEKQKMLSLVACVRLHSLGLLNDRLLPLTRKDMQRQVLRVVTKDLREIPYSPASAKKFCSSSSFQMYMYPIQQTSTVFTTVEQTLRGKGHRLALLCVEKMELSIPPIILRHPEFGATTASFGDASTVLCTEEQRQILSRVFVLLMNERWRRRSRNMNFRVKNDEEYSAAAPTISPYLVGIISREGCLDWELMNTLLAEASRSKTERTKAVLQVSKESPMAEPRLWAPLYDEPVSYIVYGPSGETCNAQFPHEKEGVNSYQDYFQKFREYSVPSDSPLFEAQRLWSKPSSLQFFDNEEDINNMVPGIRTESSRHAVCKEFASVKLAQAACLEPLLANAHVALLCSILPQCLYVYERYMNTKAFIGHCSANFSTLGPYLAQIEIDKVVSTLTAKSCSLDSNYEKLEWFGDAVLKLVQTDSLIKSLELRNWIRFLHEGDLSTLRSAMGSNDRLEKICRQLRLDKFIMACPLARGQWIPTFLEYGDGTELKKTDPVGSKVYADIIEALLGLVYLEFGYEISLKVSDDLHLTMSRTNDFLEKSPKYKASKVLQDAVHLCTGYQNFQNPELAEEAFTHPSANHPGVSSYQRLEWIGDAVLCLYMREWIFNEFQHLSLGDMVVFEAALVSNETLAFLSVRNGLQHYLRHNDHSLPSRIEAYCWNVREQGSGLWGADPPKTISDVVESVIGAVYIDGGFSHGQNAVGQIMAPLVDILLAARNEQNEIRLKHPKKILHEVGGEILELGSFLESDFATSGSATVDIFFGGRWGKANPESSMTVATVEMYDSTILAVSDPSAVVARNKACALVVDVLEKDQKLRLRLHAYRASIEKGMYISGRPRQTSDTEEEKGD